MTTGSAFGYKISWLAEKDVLTLAGRWSVDPRSLEGASLDQPWVAGA